jgi:hypothetical protein
MVYLANLGGTRLSPVYLAQLALKYDVPVVAGAPKPSTVPALAPYVAPQTYITPVVVPSQPQRMEPQTYITPQPPPALPNKPDVITSGGERRPVEVVTEEHGCTSCRSGGGATGPGTPRREDTLTGQVTAAATPLPAGAAQPGILGTLMTLGGAYMAMRGIV